MREAPDEPAVSSDCLPQRPGRFVRWFRGSLRPRPASRWEFFWMRLFLAAVVLLTLPAALPYAEQPVPVGLARWIDFTFLSRPEAWRAVRWSAAALAVAYVTAKALPLSLGGLTAIHVAVFTLYNSQGYVSHGHQIVSLVLLAQTLTAWFLAGWRALGRGDFAERAGLSAASYLIYFSQGAIAVAYVTSAVTKLVRTGGTWIWNTQNIPIALLRTRLQQHYSDPRGDVPPAPPMAQWLLDHPQWTVWLFGPGLFVELLAFLGLWNRVFAFWTGVAIIAMHRLIAAIMDLHFPLNELMAAIFFCNVPWWLAHLADRRRSSAGRAA